MNTIGISKWAVSAALLWFAVAPATALAQPGRNKDDDRNQSQQRNDAQYRKNQDRIEQRQELRQREQNYRIQQRSTRQVRSWQQQRAWAKQGQAWQGANNWNQHRAQQWQVQRRTWAQRGGYGGYYIPRNRFMVQFGSRNFFRISTRPVIVGGFPQFNYGGYRFAMVDPYPESWADDWYANDDVFVDYDDGYYLHNRRDPSVRIAITVVR